MTKTSRPMVRIHNSETNEIIDREMNNEEYDQHLTDVEAQAVANKAALDKANKKAALLQRLGLTEDELKTILG